MNPPDPRYVLQSGPEDIYLDKNTGLPLSGGQVFYYHDNARTTLKTIYELSGAPPNYTYTPLPNPMQLSGIGTPMDNVGNNVVVYYYPYDDFGLLDTYFLVVFDSLGNEQFTRENWPYPNVIGGSNTSPGSSSSGYDNEISNPQFVDVNFNPALGATIAVNGTAVTVPIAPGWNLSILSTGTGQVAVSRQSISGISGDVTNPPYTLTFVPSGLVSQIKLYQTLTNNPNIWALTVPGNPGNGFIAGSIMLGASTQNIVMNYEPSTGTPTQILSATNTSGAAAVFNNTVQIPAATNTATSDTGFVNISIYIPTSGQSVISSVQILGLETNIPNVAFEQQPANRQRDLLAHYYKPQLAFKPIPSFLVGWDFPKNPAQPLTSTVTHFAGANVSNYFWDQTIIFQTVTDSVSVTQGMDGSLVINADATTQLALIQYLDIQEAQEILSSNVSVNICGYTTQPNGITGTVSLWVTDDTALPVITGGGNPSIVATLNANGYPASLNNGTGGTHHWQEITRQGLGPAQFTLPIANTAGTTPSQFTDIGFNLFGLNNNGLITASTVKYFAIVVGFATLTMGDKLYFNSISVVPGDIPSRPAVKSFSDTLLQCQTFYWSSFPIGTAPANGTGQTSSPLYYQMTTTGRDTHFSWNYPVIMRANPNVAFYNPTPAATAGQLYDLSTAESFSLTASTVNSTNKILTVGSHYTAASASGDVLIVHATADARLGVV